MWYNQFDFKENPYDQRIPSKKIIGEDKQEKEIIRLISNNKLILLNGPTGFGKTTLINDLKNKIDKGEIEELIGFKTIKYTLEKDEGTTIKKDIRKKQFYGLLRPKIVVFIDEAHGDFYKNALQIKAYWDDQTINSIVFAQINEKHKLDQIDSRISHNRIKVKTLTEDEMTDVIKMRTEPIDIFSENALKHIVITKRNMRDALELCDDAAIKFAKKGHEITLEQIKKINAQVTKKIEKKDQQEVTTKIEKSPIEKLKVSPLQRKIISELHIADRTMAGLVEIIKNDDDKNVSLNTLNKQINLLVKKGFIIITDDNKPKKYGLETGLSRNLSQEK